MPRGHDRRAHSARLPPPRTSIPSDRDDRLLAPLRRHWIWTAIGLLVAALVAATRFVAIGVVPPSVKLKPFAHATASTQLVVAQSQALAHSAVDKYVGNYSPRATALADMITSPEVAWYVARAAALPPSKIGILGPRWSDLQRTQQWANGPKRSSEILAEKDPYQITVNGNGPIVDIETQAPTRAAAARLASAAVVGLNTYLLHLQTSTGVPKADRYAVSQLGTVSSAPAQTSQLVNVGAFTFIATFVLWCAGVVALSSLMRDLRESASASKVQGRFGRSSDSGPSMVGTD